MNKVKVLIVEDEIILAQDIANRLAAMQYDVIPDKPATVENAVHILSKNLDIDILLIDIILKGDKDGIELARIINKEYRLPFIFLTSHSDHPILERAKSVNPYAYILKPFNDRQINVAIELALVNFSRNVPGSQLLETKQFTRFDNQVLNTSDSLFLKKDNHFQKVLLKEILFFEADSNYTIIHTKCGRFIYSTVLKKIESLLPVNIFSKVHRSYLVNINCVTGFEGNLLYIGEAKIPVSKVYKKNILNMFRKI